MSLILRTFLVVFLSFIKTDSNGQSVDSLGRNKSLTAEQTLGYTLFDKKAPTFTAKTISGQTFDLSKIGDTVILLSFWFIKCPGCKPEIPYLNKLQAYYKDKKFKLVSLAWNQQEELLTFLDSVKINYDIIPNSEWVADKYYVYAYPTNFLIQKGKVRDILMFTTKHEESFTNWKKKIDKLL